MDVGAAAAGGAGERPAGPRVVVVDRRDNVACVLADVDAGEELTAALGKGLPPVTVTARQAIPFGHKVALYPVVAGGDIVRYGHPIGKTTVPVAPGDHVHVHNLRSDRAR